MDTDMKQELAEASALLETAKGPRVRKALADLIASLQSGTKAPAAAEADVAVPPEAEADSGSGSRTTAADGGDSSRDVPAAVSGSHLPEAGAAATVAAPAPMVPGASRTNLEGGVPAPPSASERKYTTVDKFAWDQGSYNSPMVTIYVPMEGVGMAKERVSCSFTTRGFDLTVQDLNGKSYRLLQNNLDKDIVADESKFLVKRNKVILKLQKVKGEYGSYDHWSNLAAKKQKKANAKADPQAGLMDMMKDMYDDGDDATKKLIGEAMMKSQQNRNAAPGSSFDKPSPYGGGGGNDLGGLGKAAGNFDSMMDDLDVDKDSGDGGWGAGGKDDFGFGSAVPPPQP